MYNNNYYVSLFCVQVLDGISDEKTTFKVCEALLNRTDLQTSLFVLHYMLTRLSHSVAINRSHYSNRLLGAKVRKKKIFFFSDLSLYTRVS